MAALARLLERLLWPAQKEEGAEEEEEGRRAPNRPRLGSSWTPRDALSGRTGRRLARAHGGRALRLARVIRAAQGWAFFAVLDGHGGARAALFGARHLPEPGARGVGPCAWRARGRVRGASPGFLGRRRTPALALPRGEPGGSTGVLLLVSPRFLYLAHCGDSRAVRSRAGAVAFSTEDQRPLRLRERELSRALGDFAYKEAPGRPPELPPVSAEPVVTALARRAEDELMLLASDGVWGRDVWRCPGGTGGTTPPLGPGPRASLRAAVAHGSLGHMTCILVRFPGAPRPCEEEGARTGCHPGLQGRRWVSSRSSAGRVVGRGTPIVLDFFSELCSSAQEPPSLNKVVRTLASEDIPDLPPGGGLYCKAAVIAEAYSQLFQASGQRWEAGSELEVAETCSSSLTSRELNILSGKEAPVSQELQQWFQSWFSSAALGHMPASHCVSNCGHKPTP
ncbi:hypothetical protein QTO34_010257, partial [Cnephaeus nilssonii]